MRARSLRLLIDVLFLVLALVWMVQDWDDRSRWGAAFWGVLAAFWVVMVVIDRNRTDDRVF